MSYSRTIWVGNLTKDPELRVTQTGKSLCTFSVAVKRRMQDVTDFHDCVVWNAQAEAVAKHFHKGKEILVEGELQNRSWEDKDGNKRWKTELIVERFSFVGRRDDRSDQKLTRQSMEVGEIEDIRFAEIEDEDSDLPF